MKTTTAAPTNSINQSFLLDTYLVGTYVLWSNKYNNQDILPSIKEEIVREDVNLSRKTSIKEDTESKDDDQKANLVASFFGSGKPAAYAQGRESNRNWL